jgi:hypothetical protein
MAQFYAGAQNLQTCIEQGPDVTQHSYHESDIWLVLFLWAPQLQGPEITDHCTTWLWNERWGSMPYWAVPLIPPPPQGTLHVSYSMVTDSSFLESKKTHVWSWSLIFSLTRVRKRTNTGDETGDQVSLLLRHVFTPLRPGRQKEQPNNMTEGQRMTDKTHGRLGRKRERIYIHGVDLSLVPKVRQSGIVVTPTHNFVALCLLTGGYFAFSVDPSCRAV